MAGGSGLRLCIYAEHFLGMEESRGEGWNIVSITNGTKDVLPPSQTISMTSYEIYELSFPEHDINRLHN